MQHAIIILDDLKARKAGIKLGLRVTGTIGVLVKAKQKGLLKQVKPVLEKIRQTNFRISELIIEEAIKEAGE